MTTFKQLESHTEAVKEALMEHLYADTWRSTSYLIQLLHKMECYFESLTEKHPENDFYTAHVALSSACNLISGTYTVPCDDERFELVDALYAASVDHFITDISDDATADLVMLGALANFVSDMRVHSINTWIEETGPSEDKFLCLKLAKRDAKAVELAVSAAAEVLFPKQN